MPISDLLSVEEERRPTFVNLDAQFLYDLAVEMDSGEMPDETTVRLRTVARHLESLDERVRNLSGKRTDLGPIIQELAQAELDNAIGWAQEGGVYNGHESEFTIEPFVAGATQLVERIRDALKPEIYEAGIVEGKRRYLMRSNLPLQPVELNPDLRQAIAKSTVPVKKLPSGKPRPVAKPSPLSLAGIKLDLSGIRKE